MLSLLHMHLCLTPVFIQLFVFLNSTPVENANFDAKPDSFLCQRASSHHVVIS